MAERFSSAAVPQLHSRPHSGALAARLLLCRVADPHQTGCVVGRLQREGRPCPMCQRPNLESHPDLYLRRKVRELRVRCPYTAGGCGWEGELGNRDAHTDSCLKKPRHCRYCSFSALREAAEEHTRGCERFPVACPNGCGVGQVHRYLLPQHLTECPLQVVRCAYAHVGCSVQLPRSEMAAHTENSAQQHTLMVFGVNVSLMESLRERVAEREQQVVELWAEMCRMEERVGERVAVEVRGTEEKGWGQRSGQWRGETEGGWGRAHSKLRVFSGEAVREEASVCACTGRPVSRAVLHAGPQPWQAGGLQLETT